MAVAKSGHKSGPGVRSKQSYLRAVIAAFDDISPWNCQSLLEKALEMGFDCDSKSCSNLMGKYKNFFKRMEKLGPLTVFTPNQRFIDRYRDEIDFYISIIPNRADQIREFFSQKPPNKLDRNDQIGGPIDIIRAVLIAHNNIFTSHDLKKMAESHGHKITDSHWSNYLLRHKNTIKKVGMRGRFIVYKPTPSMLKENMDRLDHLVGVLPALKDNLIANLKDDKVVQKRDDSPVDEQKQQAPVTDPGPEQETELNMMDAANVGASILQYITSLKKEIKILKVRYPNELVELRRKYDDSIQSVINLRNENQSLSGQLAKLKNIIQENNDKILHLTDRLGAIQNRIESESKVLPGKFKMSEVARMRKIIED